MGWSVLSEPGSMNGPCKPSHTKRGEPKPCEHADCRATRRMAEAPCPLCDAPIGYGTKFVDLRSLGLTHFVCALKEQDEINARRA